MLAETKARNRAAAAICVLLTGAAPLLAQAPPPAAPAAPPAKPTAELDATWGSPDHMLFLPAIYAELARRN